MLDVAIALTDSRSGDCRANDDVEHFPFIERSWLETAELVGKRLALGCYALVRRSGPDLPLICVTSQMVSPVIQ